MSGKRLAGTHTTAPTPPTRAAMDRTAMDRTAGGVCAPYPAPGPASAWAAAPDVEMLSDDPASPVRTATPDSEACDSVCGVMSHCYDMDQVRLRAAGAGRGRTGADAAAPAKRASR